MKLALPNLQYFPTEFVKAFERFQVALSIRLQLDLPEL
jgi:hypothetical protein